MIAINSLIYLGIIGIIGFSILLYLERLLINNPDKNMILILGIAIILNVMIFVFCVISFSRIKFAPGTEGPSGIRGSNGMSGSNANLAICNNITMTAGEKKFKIKKTDLQLPKKPYIIDD